MSTITLDELLTAWKSLLEMLLVEARDNDAYVVALENDMMMPDCSCKRCGVNITSEDVNLAKSVASESWGRCQYVDAVVDRLKDLVKLGPTIEVSKVLLPPIR